MQSQIPSANTFIHESIQALTLNMSIELTKMENACKEQETKVQQKVELSNVNK